MAEGRPSFDAPRRAGGDGVPEVFCADEQSDTHVDVERWRRLALGALGAQGVRGWAELSVFFVDEDTIAALNREHMGKQGPTDVLAFPVDGADLRPDVNGPGAMSRGPDRADPDPDDVPLLLGDVVICPSVARGQFADHAGTFDDEIALLLVHGVLHVLGFDHDTPETTSEMRAREMAILEEHFWDGPAPVGFRQGHDE
ncbi:MAG: rRNA maturation RNase YbeY [Acidimicrobiales bacterium]